MQGLHILEENHFSLDDGMGPEPCEKCPRILSLQDGIVTSGPEEDIKECTVQEQEVCKAARKE